MVVREPWFEFVPYEADVAAALQKARERVFGAGTYTRTGRKAPRTIEAALKAAGEEGTNSVLDVTHVATKAADAAVAPFPRAVLLRLFGTDRPTKQLWWANYCAVWDRLAPGRGVYVVLFENDAPAELVFAGLAAD